MPRTAIAPVAVTRAGLTAPAETAADVPNGNSVLNTNQNVILVVRNADSGAHNFTIAYAGTVDGVAPAARVVSVAAGVTKYFGPFKRSDYGSTLQINGADANIKITALIVSI